MNRIDQVIELAGRLARKREEAAALQAELEALLGRGGAADEPEPQSPKADDPVRAKRETEAAATPATNGASKGKGTGHYPRQTDALREKVVQLTKEGLAPDAIATRLGVDRRTVSDFLYRARRAGQIPKAEKRQ